MLNRLTPQATAMSLAALVTLATLGGLDALADGQYNSAATEYAEANAPIIQQVEIVGNAVQQVVVTGRKRG
ncbi:hypothetical protein [Ideonella sp. BN130291]|uniref:hypothetical protein n=1 Tax=Ideonella sp. BN130291 TaxID=3112940 RepID=UPI002E26F5E2|nr:hypothetical protein [Ideonella sp. BN130291]